MVENFKSYWLEFFSDSSHYTLEIEDDGIIETITISSPNPKNTSSIEIMIFLDDGNYMYMFDIRFYNPELQGLSQMNNSDSYGFDGHKNNYNRENVGQMTEVVNGFLKNGCSETSFEFDNQTYKYEFIFVRNNVDFKFEFKPNGDNIIKRLIRTLNKSQIKTETVKIKNWC
jgi:hypothetical protein